ncbi:MAG: phase variable surface lipoprotein [Candidatus Phytoplasma australasiaticum]|nr:phase variable surface lipoprotein [Candidatus Phytoplasma australasiaticum]
MYNHEDRIIIRGQRSATTNPNLPQIKFFLAALPMEILLTINIIPHTKKKHTYQKATFLIENQTLYLDTSLLEEIKNYKKELIQTKAQKSEKEMKILANALQNHFPLFQINYLDETKDRIKKILGNINIEKLETLRIFELDPTKVDKYGRPLKTNYKKGLNILYYRLDDLKYINFFLTKAKQGYRVKKLRPDYKRYLKQENL